MATQGERRADTRRRLLTAAAELFAERGVDGTSIDAIAERADRTSGAVYDHFGGKDGVLFALLDNWAEELAVVVGAELETTTTLEERLAVLWRNLSRPVAAGDRWMSLELELWTYAARNADARDHLVRRYRGAWKHVVGLAGRSGATSPDVGPAVIGLLLGLELMRRVDPASVTDELAVAALVGVVAGTAQGTTEPARTTPSRNGRTTRTTSSTRSTARTTEGAATG